MDIGLFEDAGTVTISTAVQIVMTAGFHTRGKGIARYKRMDAAPSLADAWGEDYWWFQSADSAYWELAEEKPDLLQFGGIDDGDHSYADNSVTGTDNAPMLNALLFYCQVKGLPSAYVPSGKYTFEDVIHVGYGAGTLGPVVNANASHINLIGSHPLYVGAAGIPSFNGTAFFTTQSDRPLLNVQGNRKCEISGIKFVGLFGKYCIDNNFCVITPIEIDEEDLDPMHPPRTPTVDDRDIDNWFDPSLSEFQDDRYTPYAAVTIDAYCGDRPSSPYASYPDAYYPDYTEIETQWNKGLTSEVNFIDCTFEGFIAGVAVQPCDYDGNGDFVRFYRCEWEWCKYGVTIGNTQSRNVGLYDCNPVFVHTMLEGLTHGRQDGRFAGPVVNMSGGEMMQLVNMSGSVGAPVSFYDCYIEGLDRIGNLYGGAAGGLAFIGGNLLFGLDSYQNVRGTPANQFSASSERHKGATYSDASLRFVNTSLTYRGALVLLSVDVSIKGGITSDFEIDSLDLTTDPMATVPTYAALANNALAGGVVTPFFGGRPEQAKADISSHFRVQNLSTGHPVAYKAVADSVWGDATRDYGSPAYASLLQAYPLTSAVQAEKAIAIVPKAAYFPAVTVGMSTVPGLSLDYDSTMKKLVLEGKFLNGPTPEKQFILPGDVLTDDQTGLTFHVFSYDDTTRLMRAVLVNGYRGFDEMTVELVDTFSLTEGNLHTCTGRRYTPGFPLFVTSQASKTFTGTTTNGSAIVTGVTSGAAMYSNVVDASAVLVGLKVSGTGIPADTYCVGVSGTTVLLSTAATASGTPSLTFGVSSSTLKNVGDIRGIASAETQVEVGDYWGSDGYVENLGTETAKVTAIDDDTATITLSSNAQLPPVTRQRVRSLRMEAPANL